MPESPLFRLSIAAQREELKHERGPNGMIRGAAWIEITRAVLIALRDMRLSDSDLDVVEVVDMVNEIVAVAD